MTYVRPTFRHPDLPKNKINFTKKDYEGAIKDLKRVVKTLQDYNDQDGLGLAHKYLGNAFNEQKKYDEALRYYNMALVYFESASNRSEIASVCRKRI